MQPKHAQAGALDWYRSGWQWFMTNPVIWILLIAAYFILLLALQLIPLVGSLMGAVLWPGLSAGLLIAARKSSQGASISMNDLFSALANPESRPGLLHLGTISLTVALLSGFAIFKLGGADLMSVLSQRNPAVMSDESMVLMRSQFPVIMSIMLIISAITAILFMYAVPLVTFEGTPAFAAIKASLWASVINMLPLFIFSMLYLAFAMLASLPFMLGFLILMPVSICAWYASYVDIFPDRSESEISRAV